MQFYYPGDGEINRIVAWFKAHLHAIAVSINNDLPEACVMLVYSGVDALGLLAAPPSVTDASRETFKTWCETYLLPRLKAIESDPLTSLDLWGARCGILHTSTPASRLGRDGKAREIWYHFRGKTAVRMRGDFASQPLRMDVEALAIAFKESGLAFISELNNDPARFRTAHDRAEHFLRWGTIVE